jgi:hypothetical protein
VTAVAVLVVLLVALGSVIGWRLGAASVQRDGPGSERSAVGEQDVGGEAAGGSGKSAAEPEAARPPPPEEPEPPPMPDPSLLGGELRVQADFDAAPLGRLSAETLRSQFETHGAVVHNAEDDDLKQLSIVPDPEGSGRVLQTLLPPRQVGGVMNFFVNLEDPPGFEEAWLSYRVRFGDGFDWEPLGGKIPGLAGRPTHNDPVPSGGREVGGFSARGSFRSGMSETGGNPTLTQYIYHQNRDRNWGEQNIYTDPEGRHPALEENQWYEITTRVVMNDPGRRNGSVEAWLDGVKMLSAERFEFRDDDSWAVNVLFMAGFMGGANQQWFHDQAETIYYDDFTVHGMRSKGSS